MFIEHSSRSDMNTNITSIRSEIEEQTKRLQPHFTRFLMEGDKDPEEYGDELVFGECWTWKDPQDVEYWSIVLTPASEHVSF